MVDSQKYTEHIISIICCKVYGKSQNNITSIENYLGPRKHAVLSAEGYVNNCGTNRFY